MDIKKNKSKFNKNKSKGNTRVRKKVEKRMLAVVLLCFLGFAVILGRAVHLQVMDNKELKGIANKQYNAKIPVSLRRGRILDRKGGDLAISLPVPSIFADPQTIENPETASIELAKILNMKASDIASKLDSSKRFVWLKRRVTYDILKEVQALGLLGISYVEESRRYYPNADLAAHLLGAVGYDSQALAGLELSYGDILSSREEVTTYKRDAKGRFYTVPRGFGEQSNFSEIYLTIDKQIQSFAEEVLKKAVEDYEAVDGTAIVMSTSNGEILAMANMPSFDPNRYSKFPIANWRNRAVTDTYEPGSTFKVLIVASALDAGIVNPETIYYCENGAIRVGVEVLKDHHPYKRITVKDIIKYSSNIGALKIAFDLGKKELYKRLKEFGIGFPTDIDYPGEATGVLRDYKTWQPVEHATVAFGQGLTTTPLQLVAAFSAAINGGIYYKPELISRIVDSRGHAAYSSPKIVSTPISAATSTVMREILRGVVEEGGTGTRAFSTMYSIGGKTGTAQKVKGGKKYAERKYYSSFIGFAPVDDPKIVVFVGLNEPRVGYYGGAVAAPAVKEVIEQTLSYMGVPSKTSPVVVTKDIQNSSADVKDYYISQERKELEFPKLANGRYVMPDLKGYTMRDVIAASTFAELETATEGSGVVLAQKPLPGTTLSRGERISIRLELPK